MEDALQPITRSAENPLQAGLSAARANLVPGAILWLVGLLILGAYFLWPAAQPVFEAVARVKVRFGIVFAMISTAIVAGVLPFFLKRLQKDDPAPEGWRELVFYVLFWAAKGAEVDLLYRFNAAAFGTDNALSTLIIKVLFDQLIYLPIWGGLNVVLIYHWKDCGFSWRTFVERLGPQWIRRRLLPVYIANWAVWVPAVFMIYSLELPLQLPIQNVVLCFWVLMLTVMTSRAAERSAPAAA